MTLKPKFTHDNLEWLIHIPGDPMPCSPDTLVRVLFQEYCVYNSPTPACDLRWGDDNRHNNIIGWHPMEQTNHELRKEQ